MSMKVLHIVFEAPVATGSGAQLRSRALGGSLRRLASVTTLVLRDHLPPGAAVRNHQEARVVLELPRPLVDMVMTVSRNIKPDVVVVESVRLADVTHPLVDAGYIVVLDAHNVESALLREIDRSRRGPLATILYRNRWSGVIAAETGVARRVASVWACSPGDASRLAAMAHDPARVMVVPNPVPGWCFTPPSRLPCQGVAALFVGHLGYRPNVLAAERLGRRILPPLRARMGDVQLTLAGRAPNRRIRALEGIVGLHLCADPLDLRPLYARANMAIIPLTEGGGTRIKVLEAMACGVPVIATAKAVTGLGLQHREHFLMAETDAEFVRAAMELMDSVALRNHLRLTAREFVGQNHGPQAINMAVSDALCRTMELHPNG